MVHNIELIQTLKEKISSLEPLISSGSGISRSRGDSIAKQLNSLFKQITNLKNEPEPQTTITENKSISPLILIGLIGALLIIFKGR